MTQLSQLERQSIRQQIRQARRALSPMQQQAAATKLLEQVKHQISDSPKLTLALYLSADGEIDTQPVIEWLWQQGHQVVLPVIHPFSQGELLFLRYSKQSVMVENRYKILEPKLDATQIIPLAQIDIIFTPLVAFDAEGNRMGMGGGYYDRTLASWSTLRSNTRSIGLAHECQQVAKLPCESWDIPLDKIFTPNKIWGWEIDC
ncbi:5-formyltetrahydrofolate cyclo-ligase [Vibrio sp. SCSIO 43136]|uniref:5-formyltetrahydrofolate cyclo-ligase n=1 Tax=Vibrio sp. SCSIO 43136 TaxID=2819101 RepID=UPI002074EBFE|nr:5-formyltetrahydrofolate cyclo-ligase [Vibrio sp. SCSIO 43136]USD65639.1 5-formyltetrahydrofolate cyclo-ligase [Vibrio sp. SCSIO 43136]